MRAPALYDEQGVPYAVGAWWYPGQPVGRQFIYPNDQRVKSAN